MSTSSALEHFVEHALEVHAPKLERSFPGCFDWMQLCADTPELVAKASDGRFDPSDAAQAHRLQEQADAVFRTAHTVGLAVLCAADDETADPEAVLDRFDDAPEDEEEARFEVLATEVLGPAEEFLIDPEQPLDGRGVEVQRLYGIAWSHVAEYVARLVILLEDEVETEDGEPAPDEALSVLMALARIATLLAALRWMAEPDAAS